MFRHVKDVNGEVDLDGVIAVARHIQVEFLVGDGPPDERAESLRSEENAQLAAGTRMPYISRASWTSRSTIGAEDIRNPKEG